MNRRLSIFVIILFFLLPVAARAQVTGSFRFAQLTDIHLNPNNPKPTEDLKRSVEQINATPGIDFVLVTGDLTEEGDRTTMLVVKSILDQLKVKYYVIPGNHETKWSDSGCTAFSEIFGGERFKFEHKGFLFLGFNSGPLMRMAYGVGVNLAVSFSCIVGCPICKIYLVDHGYRNFKEKIHFME